MKTSYKIALLVALAVSLPLASAGKLSAARDECRAKIANFRDPRVITFDQFMGDVDSVSMLPNVALQSKDCGYYLTLHGRGDGRLFEADGGSSGETLQFTVTDSSGRAVSNGQDRADAFTVFAPRRGGEDEDGDSADSGQGRESRELFIVLDPRQGRTLLGPGTYTGDLTLSLYGFDDQSEYLLDQQTVSVVVEVPTQAGISVAGSSGGSFRQGRRYHVMDFGDLETGESQDAYIWIWSNVNFSIAFASSNRGVMQHEEYEQGGREYQVDYVARFNGSQLGLDSPLALLDGAGPTEPNGRAYQFTVQIGDVQNKIAGPYSDTVEVSITASR